MLRSIVNILLSKRKEKWYFTINHILSHSSSKEFRAAYMIISYFILTTILSDMLGSENETGPRSLVSVMTEWKFNSRPPGSTLITVPHWLFLLFVMKSITVLLGKCGNSKDGMERVWVILFHLHWYVVVQESQQFYERKGKSESIFFIFSALCILSCIQTKIPKYN